MNLNDDTSFLKFLAILLVINSHMDVFYGNHYFATGGALGNSLFFMLSSFGLAISEKNRPQNFWFYLYKRIRRIYPPVWSSVLFILTPLLVYYYYIDSSLAVDTLRQEINFFNPISFFSAIFFPPPTFWFLQALMVYYVICFPCIKKPRSNLLLAWSIPAVLLYFMIYLDVADFSVLVIEQQLEFKVLFYYLVFLFGIYLASYTEKITYSGFSDIVMALLVLVVIYGHKIFMSRGLLGEYQWMEQLLIFPFLFYALKLARSPVIAKIFKLNNIVATFINLTVVMTLELYIVHGPIREYLIFDLGFFPANPLFFLLITYVVAYIFLKLNRVIALNLPLWQNVKNNK